MDVAFGASGVLTYLASCIQGYKVIASFMSDMRHMPKEAAQLEAQSNVEANRLLIWARIHNLTGENSQRVDDRTRDHLALPNTTKSILSILADIQKKQEEAQKIADKYILNAPVVEGSNDDAGDPHELPVESLTFDLSRSPLEHPDVTVASQMRNHRLQSIGGSGFSALRRRTSWAMKGLQSLGDCIKALESYNNKLYELTLPSLYSLMYEALTSMIPRLDASNSLTSRVDALETYTHAVAQSPRTKQELDAQISAWILQSQDESALPQHTISLAQIINLKEYPRTDYRERCISQREYQGTRSDILVDWRSYNPRNISSENVVVRLNGLVSLLKSTPPSLPSLLRAVGFFEDSRPSNSTSTKWFGIVYELPQPPLGRALRALQSLRSLIEKPRQPDGPRERPQRAFQAPPLGQRFRLARRLSEILLSIHNCGWLHKGIFPENIVFLPAPDIDFENPFLVGWNYSRKIGEEMLSETVVAPNSDDMLYRHPDHIKRQYYRQEFDQYQLGCLLIEIAYWESLSDLREEMTSKPDPGSEEWLTRLVRMGERLKREMGEIYSRVVVQLLQCPRFDSRVGDFWEDIVLALYQCNA